MPDNTLVHLHIPYTYTDVSTHVLTHALTHTHHTDFCLPLHPPPLHREPKAASLSSDASTPASHLLHQPGDSGQQQQQPRHLLIRKCFANMVLGNYGLRPLVKPEAEVGGALGSPCGLHPTLLQKEPDSNCGQWIVTLERSSKKFLPGGYGVKRKQTPLPFSSVLPGGPAVAPGPRLSSQG